MLKGRTSLLHEMHVLDMTVRFKVHRDWESLDNVPVILKFGVAIMNLCVKTFNCDPTSFRVEFIVLPSESGCESSVR
ncbi:hypothetical protein G7Y89_g9379 [Cudoniella acicularis]|uniref:Uncharacterized protein n=1 Tax=Cudoniella acicularis TaxID=354080 RepID=A0A8H4RGZ7_9HELO|nr:hypothetical protein G7Y89_g9379 [Cudoniella acicularis]